MTLPTFTPTKPFTDWIYSCSGPGHLMFVGSDGSIATQDVCDSGRVFESSGTGSEVQVSLEIEADPAMTWEILIYGTDTSPEGS